MVMKLSSRSSVVLLAMLAMLGVVACRDAKSKEEPAKLQPAAVVPTTTPEGSATAVPKKDEKEKDKKKGDKEDSDWTPAEHKAGMARWKDTGVYVDGQPVGFLSWGELPIGLKPTWVKDKVSDRKRPGTNDPGWKWARQRMYKFKDYIKAVGVDVRSIKELHVYGPKMSMTLIVTQKDLQTPLSDEFMFRFGMNTGGKAIAHSPGGFGNGKVADKISAVMIYIKKTPPSLVRNEGLTLSKVGDPKLIEWKGDESFFEGKKIEWERGVPYYGEPIRGGIRIYLDDKLATIIKRQELDPKLATTSPDGELHWKLADVLKTVDTTKVVDVWVIRDERRAEKLPAADLATMTFAASSQAKGGILLTEKKIRTQAIALHTRALKPEELPAVTPDDE